MLWPCVDACANIDGEHENNVEAFLSREAGDIYIYIYIVSVVVAQPRMAAPIHRVGRLMADKSGPRAEQIPAITRAWIVASG